MKLDPDDPLATDAPAPARLLGMWRRALGDEHRGGGDGGHLDGGYLEAATSTTNRSPRSRAAELGPASEQFTRLLDALDAIDFDGAYAARRTQIASLELLPLSEPRLELARVTCVEAHRTLIEAEIEPRSAG